jgi:methionyl-tRNA synthetase
MAWNEARLADGLAGKEQYCLPQNVPANEFLNFEGKKFSKSRGWGIDVDEFLNLFPADLLRYTLAANLPENRDTDFYWKEFQLRNNSELADILGNFINRTFTFVFKHFDGKVPARGKFDKIDEDMLKEIGEYPKRVSDLFEKYRIRDGVNEMMNLARDGNKYFNDSEPWITIKTNKEKCATTLNVCLQTIYTLAELFNPVLPFSSEKLFKMLNSKTVKWSESGKPFLKEGHQIISAEILFPKIEDEVIEEQISKLGNPVSDNEKEKAKDELISYEDFMKTKLKVAEVLSAEKIAKSKKLMKLRVMLDDGERQVVAGIAEHYSPEDLIGKKVVVVANLQPAKLMGEESHGMILAVEKESGCMQVIIVDNSVKNGTRVK